MSRVRAVRAIRSCHPAECTANRILCGTALVEQGTPRIPIDVIPLDRVEHIAKIGIDHRQHFVLPLVPTLIGADGVIRIWM